MANEQNLIPFTSDQSREEAVKNGRIGGYASGESRRKRKALRDSMNMLLEKQPSAKDFNKLVEAGFDPEEIDNSLLITYALFNESDMEEIKDHLYKRRDPGRCCPSGRRDLP